VAIGTGYLLGRRHRLRLALILAIAAATGRLGTAPREMLQRGSRMLGSSPELANLAKLGTPLASAGKAAATAVVTTRIRSITERLDAQTEALRAAGAWATGSQPPPND
jgi:hypothetical protein